ncbi:MAG: cell division ATP-binding protein FtsE [Cyanobacteria bacterium J06650_10]
MISILSPKAFRKAVPEPQSNSGNTRQHPQRPTGENTQPLVDRAVPPPASVPQAVAATGTNADATESPIINISQVSKTYPNGTPALIDINFSLNRGDFLFVTGPSGAGKSTLLKMLYGQERPTAGHIHINGKEISKLKGDRLALVRRRIGVIFQDYKLIPKRTVAENVAFVLHAQGYSRKEIDRRLPLTLKMVGLQDKANRFPSQLSGGEQQRASIARAVVGTPPLLLADEPTGNLDGDNARQVFSILRKLNSIGITVVVTTHDEGIVRSLNYPVIQIRDHRLYNIR